MLGLKFLFVAMKRRFTDFCFFRYLFSEGRDWRAVGQSEGCMWDGRSEGMERVRKRRRKGTGEKGKREIETRGMGGGRERGIGPLIFGLSTNLAE